MPQRKAKKTKASSTKTAKKPEIELDELSAVAMGGALQMKKLVESALAVRIADFMFDDLLGGIQMPGVDSAEDCTGMCKGSCKGSCQGSCDSYCTGSCKGGCGNTCSGDCSGSCQGDCAGTTKGSGQFKTPQIDDLISRQLSEFRPVLDGVRDALLRAGYPH